jgi:hypothetical protein
MDITKLDVAVMVIGKNGPMTRKDLMRKVAEVEGKPFRETSNQCYFLKKPRRLPYGGYGTSWRAEGYIDIVGKRGNAFLWGLTKRGGEHYLKALVNIRKAQDQIERMLILTKD